MLPQPLCPAHCLALSVHAGRAVCTSEPKLMSRPPFLATHVRENCPGHPCQAGSWRKTGSADGSRSWSRALESWHVVSYCSSQRWEHPLCKQDPVAGVGRGCQDITCQSQSKEHRDARLCPSPAHGPSQACPGQAA